MHTVQYLVLRQQDSSVRLRDDAGHEAAEAAARIIALEPSWADYPCRAAG